MHEYCAEIVHGYLVHQCYAAHHGHHHVRGDVRDHDHGLNLPCEYGLDQYRCQYHDCDGDDQVHDDDHPLRQNWTSQQCDYDDDDVGHHYGQTDHDVVREWSRSLFVRQPYDYWILISGKW